MSLKACCICLTKMDTFLSLTHPDEDDTEVSILKKLQYIAPEHEWLHIFLICPRCSTKLDEAYNFKKLCSSSESFRNNYTSSSCEDNNAVEMEISSITEEKTMECKETFICFNCNKHFKTKNLLKKHTRTGHKKISHSSSQNSSKFQCEVCKEHFPSLKNIINHCSNQHSMKAKEIKPYCCDTCKSKFRSSSLLKQHTQYHRDRREFICSTCGKSFVTKQDLLSHEKLHADQRKYICDKCNKSFKTNQNLKTHIYVVHTDSSQWKYSCNVCSKRFAMKANCNEHMNRHKGNRGFLCHICTKAFVSHHELKKHVKLHSNISSFKCSECSNHYRDNRSLSIHLFKVHNLGKCKLPIRVRKFVCHICPSQFFDNHKLQRHLRTHTGVKPFSCDECDKRFIDRSYLLCHLKNVHNIVRNDSRLD